MKFSRRNNQPSVPSRRQGGSAPRQSESTSQFRRNLTMSGVRQESSDPAVSERAKAHDLVQRRRKVGGIFLLVLAGIAVLALLITQLTARVLITNADETLSASVDATPYEQAINDYLGIHPVERLRFALNEDGLTEYVTALTPEVKSVKQSGANDLLDTHFTLTFRKPLAGWVINDRHYFVDEDGIVFEKNFYETPTVTIVDESGVSPEQGSMVASARLLSFVGRVVALSREGGYEVTEAILPIGSTRTLEFRLKDVTPRVRLTIDRGAGEQVEDMTRALRYLASQGQAPGYVDVRISGRAVYQ